MKNKKVNWNKNVYTPIIKRPCECYGCFGCNKNTKCNIFGYLICNKCIEYRCNKCIKIEICKNCLKEY